MTPPVITDDITQIILGRMARAGRTLLDAWHINLVPWGYGLSGTVRWRGEEFDDVGRIDVRANIVTATAGHA